MRPIARGALTGAGFGLAVAVAEAWIGAAQTMRFNVPAPVVVLANGALIGIGLGMALGALLALVPGVGGRSGRHLLAIAFAWAALVVYAAPDTLRFRLFALAGPVLGMGLVRLGHRIGRRRPWAPAALGVALLLAAFVTPGVRLWLRAPAVRAQAPRQTAPRGAPDVVIVVLDTVRADHVSAYGYERPTTPALDGLAREGALFEEAIAPATWSLPSHASLFTGRFVSAHGAHDEHRFLAPGSPTLAETLAAAGWDTRCFTANAWISDGLGLTRGFAWCDEAWRAGDVGRVFHGMYRLIDKLGLGAEDKGGAEVVGHFEHWLAGRPSDDAPAFAFLNFIEAHFPYHQLPDEYLARFTSLSRSRLRTLSLELFAGQFGDRLPAVAEVVPAATAMYDAGILYADMLLGRVVDAVRRRGTLDRTVVVVLADHGEMLGEHGEFGHGHSLYEPVLRVPLVVRYPSRIPAGVRVSRPVSTVGVYATVLDLAGVPAPPTLQVGSLAPAVAGRPVSGPVLAEQFVSWLGSEPAAPDPLLRHDARFRAYRVGDRKLVQATPGGDHLFDLDGDPGETRDLATIDGDSVARLRNELETWRAALGLPPLDAALDGTAIPEMDPAAHERLRALGYVQ